MLLVLLLVFIATTNACSPKQPKITDLSCKTSDGSLGTCVPLTKCPTVAKRVVTSSDSITDILPEGDPCGVISHRLHVCCGRIGRQQSDVPTDVDVSTDDPNPLNTHPNRALLPTNCGAGTGNRIHGGEEVQIDEFPWLVLLQHKIVRSGEELFGCGGSLISPRYVLTAAHCINATDRYGLIIMNVQRVRVGEYDINSTNECVGSGSMRRCNGDFTQDIDIEDYVIHPSYNYKKVGNDIALIRLKKEADINQFVYPICLPFDDLKNYTGYPLVAGWGQTEKGFQSNVKKKVKVPVREWMKHCRRFGIQPQVVNSHICAGGERGKDSCKGDSGGPLMEFRNTKSGVSKWFAIGIVSQGPYPCGTENKAGVYTKVSAFTDWILDNIRK